MFSRVTLLEIDTMRIDPVDATSLFKEHVLPGLEEQDGYEGVIVLTTPEGKGMIITLWETEEGARDASGFAAAELERYMTMFKAPPGREHYEVVFADTPSFTVTY
jgi:hypothetical protein